MNEQTGNDSPIPTIAFAIGIEATQFQDQQVAVSVRLAEGRFLVGPDQNKTFPLNRIFAAALLTASAKILLDLEIEAPNGFMATTERFGQTLNQIVKLVESQTNPSPELIALSDLAAQALNPSLPPDQSESSDQADGSDRIETPSLTLVEGGAANPGIPQDGESA